MECEHGFEALRPTVDGRTGGMGIACITCGHVLDAYEVYESGSAYANGLGDELKEAHG